MLAVEHLSKTYTSGFFLNKTEVHAVRDVSFSIRSDEIFGLVGESGCGKTTLGKMLVRLLEPTGGRVKIGDLDVTNLKGAELQRYWPNLQMIFQDPRSSLNPRMRIGDSLVEGLLLSGKRDLIEDTVQEIIRSMNIREEILNRYPHEVSGGEIQRIVIARAISLNPALIVADEPTSNLDLSVQAQILTLIKNIQKEHPIPCVLISHDIEIVQWMCDRTAVMLRGRIVEEGPTDDLIQNPLHPYTQELINASLFCGEKIEYHNPEVSQTTDEGCPYKERCSMVKQECRIGEVQLRGGIHKVACRAVSEN
ncbi:Oligopeptide transport ATP-binding protein OppF [Methanosarcina horonobensis HB-1 = JCM 15518]|uniref:Oligopeptide transport ATP-binding protein OppF n=2 Tax=Methanosarcina horonobensis TaxID=418008 RepID=A0A0E3SBJ9_9EURY|nr:Oligopeptide transport ATP-binding protein OppF [Methanosarcina horonobensis HB-1 = JCM 15518]